VCCTLWQLCLFFPFLMWGETESLGIATANEPMYPSRMMDGKIALTGW
jgi:hypothetical protein